VISKKENNDKFSKMKFIKIHEELLFGTENGEVFQK